MYAGVPMPSIIVDSVFIIAAEPKSVILMSLFSFSMMFAGLMSRWITPCCDAYSSARAHVDHLDHGTDAQQIGRLGKALQRAAFDILHDNVRILVFGHGIVNLHD